MVPAYNETTYEMTAMDEARHHAISKKFGKTIAMEKELVIQYVHGSYYAVRADRVQMTRATSPRSTLRTHLGKA